MEVTNSRGQGLSLGWMEGHCEWEGRGKGLLPLSVFPLFRVTAFSMLSTLLTLACFHVITQIAGGGSSDKP